MNIYNSYSYQRYLAVKKSIDNDSLNRRIWNRLALEIPQNLKKPIEVLEIGAGIGTMLERTLEWGLLQRATYTAIDKDSSNIKEAYRRLSKWSNRNDYTFQENSNNLFILQKKNIQIKVELEAIDIFDFIKREQNKSWNLLFSHSFFDLINIDEILPPLFSILNSNGLFYFTLNFDGETIFQPEIDYQLDTQIINLYHKTMDNRIINGKPSGDSQTGRHLYHYIKKIGGKILDAASSDWFIFPRYGEYTEDEVYFLHFILNTFYNALQNNKEIDKKDLVEWINTRHKQIDEKELIYISHQLDYLGRKN